MHNINAFFKLRAKEMGLSNKEIAEQYSFSKTFISRTFNRQSKIEDNRDLLKFCKCLKLKKDEVLFIDKDFENKVEKYMHAVYFIESNRLDCFNEVMAYKNQYKDTPYYIDLILIEFIQNVLLNKFDSTYQILREKIHYIDKALFPEEKKLFLIFEFRALTYQYIFEEAEAVFEKASKIETNIDDLNMMLGYFAFRFKWKNNPLAKNIENYYECKKYCEKTNNINRLFNIEVRYAMFLGAHGDIQSELDYELYLLDYANKMGIKRNKAVLINNIAYAYCLLKQYDQAIKYYLENFKEHQDNDTCFHLAWCYYNVNDNKEAKKYLNIGVNGSNHASYFYLLLEWLQAMMNKKYSTKTCELLLELKNDYSGKMPEETRNFVLMELYNYYHYRHNEEELFKIGQELLNRDVVCVTEIREED